MTQNCRNAAGCVITQRSCSLAVCCALDKCTMKVSTSSAHSGCNVRQGCLLFTCRRHVACGATFAAANAVQHSQGHLAAQRMHCRRLSLAVSCNEQNCMHLGCHQGVIYVKRGCSVICLAQLERSPPEILVFGLQAQASTNLKFNIQSCQLLPGEAKIF